MLQLLITVGGSTEDYTRYVDGRSIHIAEQINIPSQMTFSLSPIGWAFKVPPQRAYVRLYSPVTDRSIFTGFISTEPTRVYLAKAAVAPATQGGQLFRYDITCTSDEYLLNLKAIPFIPAFVNRSQGDILTALANILCPNFFDTSMVASGDIVPYFQYNPQQSWCELAKQFADGSRYRYKARDKQIFFTPYGDQPLGIYYDEQTQTQAMFAPKDLNTTVLSVPIVNDVTMIGNTEGGNNREDYFIGDGFTANFPLLHKVFRGSETLLIQESWNNTALNTQNWFLQDPGVNFDFSAGALNVTDTLPDPFDLGFSYLLMNNGLEIAGGIDTQVGECIFADYCQGMLGGIYTDTALSATGFLAGFQLTTPSGVVTSASGAAGIVIQPMFGATGVGPSVVSKVNHSYVLQMTIHAPKYTRYTTIYRTTEGEQYGGATSTVQSNISFSIQEYDIAAATGFFYQPKVIQSSLENVTLPAFAVYALVNNQKLNVSITNTTIAMMPLGGLSALEGPSGLFQPTGLILPMLPPDSGGYIGPVPSWPSAATANILPPPGALNTIQDVLVMGQGLALQSAQVTQGQAADTLSFYAQTTPAAGTRVRYQSWEAQAAVSRLQVSGSIYEESFVVGDDGVRSAIVSNLNPLPRTSEDCDNAALAFLQDRVKTYYNGTYQCTSLFFNGLTSDIQFWPCVGRFLNVNAPRRGIDSQKFLVVQLDITILDLVTELLAFNIQFGADLYLEKVLLNFVDIQPANVLTPQNITNPPNPRFTQAVTSSFLPDLQNVQASLLGIGPSGVLVNVFDNYYGPIEVRRQDTNWGRGKTLDYVATVTGPSFTLPRQQYDQVWYLRPVLNDVAAVQLITAISQAASPATMLDVDQWAYYVQQVTGIPISPTILGTMITVVGGRPVTITATAFVTLLQQYQILPQVIGQPSGTLLSRRSKVIRVRWPLAPAPPLFIGQNQNVMQFNFNGDLRNIYGFELRADTEFGTMVLVQKPVTSYADLGIDITQTPFVETQDFSSPTWKFYAYFFNTAWVYSPVTPATGAPFINTLIPQATFIFGRSGTGGPADITVYNPDTGDGSTNLAIVKTPGRLQAWDMVAEEAPSGTGASGALIIDIWRQGVSIFGAGPKPTLPSGVSGLITGYVFDAITDLKQGDLLKGVVLQVGNIVPGQSATINLYWE